MRNGGLGRTHAKLFDDMGDAQIRAFHRATHECVSPLLASPLAVLLSKNKWRGFLKLKPLSLVTSSSGRLGATMRSAALRSDAGANILRFAKSPSCTNDETRLCMVIVL